MDLGALGLSWRLLLAIASGVLLALAFPPVGASLLAPVAVALFVIATFRTTAWRGALLGAIQGGVSFAILPVGWPEGSFGPVARGPLAAVVHKDRWGAPYF